MNQGILSLISGSIAQETNLEVIANNLANINTPGFKRDNPVFKSYLAEELNTLNPEQLVENKSSTFLEVDHTQISMEQGALVNTENPFDVAIDGEGFFTIQAEDGLRFTRNGSFALSQDRTLVTKSGDPVLGNGGVIHIPEGAGKIEIDSNGNIQSSKQRYIDSLRISTIENPANLRKVGNSYFKHIDEKFFPERMDRPKVIQGSLESSNVNPIESMSDLIAASRTYEIYQKAINKYSDINRMATTQLGKL